MMRRILGWALLATLMAVLAGCGGGGSGDGGTCMLCGGDGSGTSSNTVADLRFTLSTTNIANKAPEAVTVNVTAVNSLNQTVSDAAVVVTADNGGVVTAESAATNSSGVLTATLGMGSNATPRIITLTALSGSVSRSTTIAVVDSVSGGSASMSISLSSETVTASQPATVTVTLHDANGTVVPNTVVNFSTLAGLGSFSASSALTNTAGVASVALYPVKSSASGADYVQASATVNGTALTATAGFQITSTSVTIQSFTSDLGSNAVSAYGQANLTVTLAGVPNGTPVAMSINSLCANKNKATITPTTLSTSNGVGTFTYKDAQCGATDTADTVTVSITGTSTSSTLSIPLTSPTASSLGFDSASPQVIYLKGSGFVETSTVTFVVRDQAGNPLPNQNVDLIPTTISGGLTMDGGVSQVTKLSDSDGKVTVRINSGTVPTPVRVKATLQGTNISTVSSNLSIAVGLPAQLNFSLSQTAANIEGMNYDGVQNTYQIIASDRLGNPVPAGTTINLVAEAGQVAPQVFTTVANGLGSASALAQTSEPRPYDGRVTILAYALGEESFLDANGNNVYNTGEDFQDLGDIFLSRSYSATYNPANADQFISLDKAGGVTCSSYSSYLLALNASIPSVGGTTCDGAWGKAYVRRAIETVWATSSSRILWFRNGAGLIGNLSPGIKLDSGCQKFSITTFNDGFSTSSGDYFRVGYGGLYNAPADGQLTFLVADANDNRLNPMPAGTTITASATKGLGVQLSGTPVPSSTSATAASISYLFDGATSGTITVLTTSPKGVVTPYVFGLTQSSTPTSGAACTQ